MKRIGELAPKLPTLSFVFAHSGFPVAERTPTFGFSHEHLALAVHRNVHHKYTTFLLEVLRRGGVPDKEFLSYTIGIYGADSILWGSDYGTTTGKFGDLAKRDHDSAENLTTAQKKENLYSNPTRTLEHKGP